PPVGLGYGAPRRRDLESDVLAVEHVHGRASFLDLVEPARNGGKERGDARDVRLADRLPEGIARSRELRAELDELGRALPRARELLARSEPQDEGERRG